MDAACHSPQQTNTATIAALNSASVHACARASKHECENQITRHSFMNEHDIFWRSGSGHRPSAAAAINAFPRIAYTMSSTQNLRLAPCIPNSADWLPALLACNNPDI